MKVIFIVLVAVAVAALAAAAGAQTNLPPALSERTTECL